MYTDLVVLPGTSADTRIVRSFAVADEQHSNRHNTHGCQSNDDHNDRDRNGDHDNHDNDNDDDGIDLLELDRLPLIEEQLPALPPRIVRGPADCVALVGGTVTLSVDYTTAPADGDSGDRPKVKWLLAVRTNKLVATLSR